MPVYWFGLSQAENINWWKAVLIFIILHLLVYPASNGYNSYMDRDTTPIGGVVSPMQPERQLLYVTYILNAAAVVLSFFISGIFVAGILVYILASLAYSSRRIRLKKYPFTGFLTVVSCQGALTFFLVYQGSSMLPNTPVPVLPMVAASLLIGGFYPLTQIYQHTADMRDGVITLSYRLGYRGTFIFTGIIYAFAFISLGYLFYMKSEMEKFLVLVLWLLPVLLYFFWWSLKVEKDNGEANFKNTMRMNILASVCTNLGFITIIIFQSFE